MSRDTVAGMAEAIETRRRELRLSPRDFAQAAGVTPQGLAPVRRGDRRRYQDKVRLGVARALQWPDDALDRLMAGEPADHLPTIVRDGSTPSVEDRLEKIERDLTEVRRELAEIARQLS